MKKIIYLLSITSFWSCTTIKQFKNQEIKSLTNCTNIILDKKLVFLNTQIDNKNVLMLFDTGATMSVIFDSTAINDFQQKKLGALGTVTGADQKTADLKTFTASFKNELFESNNKVFAYLKKDLLKCQIENKFKGVVGLDVFFKNNNSLYLNFSNNTVCNIDELEKNKNEFTKIKSKCTSNKIFIYITIDEREYEFKLDTGFSGTFSIPYNKDTNFNKYNSIIFEGKLFSLATAITNGEEHFFEKVPIKIGDFDLTSKILVSKTIKNQNVGIQFIKVFDWIIDYKNNDVLIRKNNNLVESENNKNAFQFITSIDNETEKLVITAKQKNSTKFNLNDEIISIDNNAVTPENICEMQNLLNSTTNWDDLKIEIKKTIK